jgi:serine/threonine-protein kinase
VSSPDLEALSAALILEVDALCDDFERHWQRARRMSSIPPSIDTFLARATPAVRPVLQRCLLELEQELRTGLVLPEIPGLVLEEEIGRGGMGVVYRARRTSDQRAVALKLIPGAEHARWSRWIAELADLHHPNLVPLEAFGTHDGLHFVVMPLVRGGDLKERLDEFTVGREGNRHALLAAAGMIGKVADAVAFLHRRGILHRDLKPSNILLASTDDPQPLVCDFGLAGRLPLESAETPPSRTLWAGTPPYMAPEQMAGRPLTPAADLWSLGAVLYELLTGRAPFVEADGRLNVSSKQSDEPVSPRLLNPAVDADLERICLRCLRRHAADRSGGAAELADDLQTYRQDNHPDVREHA